jgi:EmrB/QacA subfamily drug resistance transporter
MWIHPGTNYFYDLNFMFIINLMNEERIINQKIKSFLPWIAALAFFMQALDGTILNTALPSIARDLGYPPLAMQSVIVSYTLTLALLIPLSGWLSDRFGTRVIFIVAVALFTIGSLCCAISSNLPQLLLSRILQGIGGSMMVPVARLTVLYVYPKKFILRVMNFITIPGLVGPVIGPSLGGWLVELASWHWIFLINIPIGILGIWLAYYAMPNIKKMVGLFDTLGFILFSGALSIFTLCMEIGSTGKVDSLYLFLFFVIALLLIVLYIFHAQRVNNPLINLKLFKIRTLKIGLIGNLVTRLGIGGMPLMLPLMFQVGFGYSAATAGMILIPSALANLISKPLVVPLIKRFGHKRTLLTNTMALALIISLFALPNADTPLIYLMPLLLLYGMISSVQFTTMNTISIADLDASNSSSGNSVIAVMQQLSISFGISISALLLLNMQHIQPDVGNAVAFKYTFIALGIITAISSLIFTTLKATDGSQLSGHVR